MAEYRIGDLAQVSGVSSRNIRAYRERGLLDPPRRDGRVAIYDDHHLTQLRTVNQLLSRGFSSAHIVEFFEAMREGDDLAEILGLRALRAGGEAPVAWSVGQQTVALDIELPVSQAHRMVEIGLAEVVDGRLVLADPPVVEIMSQVPDHAVHLNEYSAALLLREPANAGDRDK